MTEQNNTQNNSDALLTFLLSQSSSGNKNWFGYNQQRIAGIYTAYELAKYHADKLTPEEIVDYVTRLNNEIFKRMIKPGG